MDTIPGVHLCDRRLGEYRERTRLPALHMGAVVEQHSVRRLREVRAKADLIAHGPGHGPQCGLFAAQFGNLVLQSVDGLVAFRIIYVIPNGGIYDGLSCKKLANHDIIYDKGRNQRGGKDIHHSLASCLW